MILDFLYDRLCRECQTLIENHDQIKLLSNARNNLNTTLKVSALVMGFYEYGRHPKSPYSLIALQAGLKRLLLSYVIWLCCSFAGC